MDNAPRSDDQRRVDAIARVLVSAILGCDDPNRAALDAWSQIVEALDTAGVELMGDVK